MKRWLAVAVVLLTLLSAGLTYHEHFPTWDKNHQLNEELRLMQGDEYLSDAQVTTVPMTETDAGRLIFQLAYVAEYPEVWGYAVYEKGLFGGIRPLYADLHEGSDLRSAYYSRGMFKDRAVVMGITVPEDVTMIGWTQMNWGEDIRTLNVTTGVPFIDTYPGDGYYVHGFNLYDKSEGFVGSQSEYSDDAGRSSRWSCTDAGRVWYTVLLESIIGFSLAWVLWQKKKETE